MIPRRKTGRQSKAAIEKYDRELKDFIQLLIRINSDVGFNMSSRGWCYALEPHGLKKGEFDYIQRIINDCRRNGLLPNNFMANEGARVFSCFEGYIDDTTPEEEAEVIVGSVRSAHEHYRPFSFWDDQQYYVQMLVEKVDLVTLFEPICRRYKIPIATSKGWSSIRQRKELIERFQEYEYQGKTPVLLYCGDFDPAGLVISDFIKSNLDELYGATFWKTTNLIIDRFGLNYEFIMENNLSWIDNLVTGSGVCLSNRRHKDHNKPYVQEYIKRYGVRKVEANAIVVAPNMGRQLCRDSINKYIKPESITRYENMISAEQRKVQIEVQRIMDAL
jgi:hypothetical protein